MKVKVVVITGATSGIGFETAKMLAADGFAVIGIGRNEERCNAATKKIVSDFPDANLDIDRNFYGVCEYVDRLVRDSLPQSASLTAPSSEGALDATVSKQ